MVTVGISEVSKLWLNMNFGWKLCEQKWRFDLKGRTCLLYNGKYLKIFTLNEVTKFTSNLI